MCGLSTTYTQTGGFRMTVHELNRDQLVELKQNFISLWIDGYEPVSYDVLMDADELIPDETIFEAYEGIFFTENDFFCSTK